MKHLILAALAATTLCACSPSTPQLDASGNPVPQAQGSSFLAPFLGSMAGSVVGNALSRPAAAPAAPLVSHSSTHTTTIIREVQKPALKAPTSPAPSLKAPAYTYRPAATTSFRSYSSGNR